MTTDYQNLSELKHDCPAFCHIKELGLKHSKDRHTIMGLFQLPRAWSKHQFIEGLADTSVPTVYRTIRVFLKHKLIKPVAVHDDHTYYEWANREHHDHLACQKCDTVECIPCQIPKQKNHVLELTDLCSSCK